MHNLFRVNNFDMIRLIAALQVAIHHTMSHLDVGHGSSVLLYVLSYFPGVPIFFFISGFLISKSYESNSQLTEYTQNRILRIFPSLILCTSLALLSVYLTGYFVDKNYSIGEFVFWVFGQISFFQFYNPEFMRGFGTGVLNGSLWTISVELQFYIMVPILYWAFGLSKEKNINRKLLFLILVFMLFHIGRYSLIGEHTESMALKLFGASFIPWIWMFLVGVFFQKNFAVMHNILAGKVLYILPSYLIISFVSTTYFEWNMGNGISPILYIALAILIFSFAYSFPMLSQNILKRNDISYGVYIYHIPVVNILIYYGYVAKNMYVILAIAITIFLASLSWLVLEKKTMAWKKHPLNPFSTTNKSNHMEL